MGCCSLDKVTSFVCLCGAASLVPSNNKKRCRVSPNGRTTSGNNVSKHGGDRMGRSAPAGARHGCHEGRSHASGAYPLSLSLSLSGTPKIAAIPRPISRKSPGTRGGARPEPALVFEGWNSPRQRGAPEFLDPGCLLRCCMVVEGLAGRSARDRRLEVYPREERDVGQSRNSG